MKPALRIAFTGTACLLMVLASCGEPQAGDPAGQDAPDRQESTGTLSMGWNNLQQGMESSEVLDLVGEPVDMKVTKVNTTWFYSKRGTDGPHVVFDTRSMTVERWNSSTKK